MWGRALEHQFDKSKIRLVIRKEVSIAEKSSGPQGKSRPCMAKNFFVMVLLLLCRSCFDTGARAARQATAGADGAEVVRPLARYKP
jgi:hypothetical protein